MAAGFLTSGCASILLKESRSFKTTRLFERICTKEEEDQFPNKFARPVKDQKGKVSLQCRVSDIEGMVQKFLSIPESNEKKGILGASVEEVRQKGFKIYLDEQTGERVPNTQALFGDEALAAIGMGAGSAQLTEDAKALSDFKGLHYGETYEEEDTLQVMDRICINTRNKFVRSNTYTFVIVWRDGHVLRRVIKGGSLNNPSSENAFLLCPGDAIGSVFDKGVGEGVKKAIP